MTPLTVSRILFGLLWVNEIFVLSRSTADERKAIVWPRFTPIPILALFVPLFITLQLPDWLGWLIVIGQVVTLGMEVFGEIQLTRAKSFSIAPKTPASPQTDRLYSYLENPIYIAGLLQLAIWGLWMPVVWIGVVLQYLAFREMVQAERRQLATVNFTHRKPDSFLWD